MNTFKSYKIRCGVTSTPPDKIIKRISRAILKGAGINILRERHAQMTPDMVTDTMGRYVVLYQRNDGEIVYSINGTEWLVNTYSSWGSEKDEHNHSGLYVTEEYAKKLGINRNEAGKKFNRTFRSYLKQTNELQAQRMTQEFIAKYEGGFMGDLYCRGRISADKKKMAYWESLERVMPVLTQHCNFFIGKGLLSPEAKLYVAGEQIEQTAGDVVNNVSQMQNEAINDEKKYYTNDEQVRDYIRNNIFRNLPISN